MGFLLSLLRINPKIGPAMAATQLRFFQLTFDAMMAAEVVIESDMMDLVSLLTNDVQDIITKVLRELPPNATHDPRLPGEMIAVDTGHYGINANRFFGFLSQVRPNRWTSRYAEQIVHNYTPNAKSAKVSIDFNHARLKLMRNWMLQCAEQSENVQREQGYIRVHQMDRCPVLVSTIVDVLVRDTFERIVSSGEQARTLLPFYKAGSTRVRPSSTTNTPVGRGRSDRRAVASEYVLHQTTQSSTGHLMQDGTQHS